MMRDKGKVIYGYATLQAPEFDEQDRLADAPVEKAKNAN
jgi:hypothetical protein